MNAVINHSNEQVSQGTGHIARTSPHVFSWAEERASLTKELAIGGRPICPRADADCPNSSHSRAHSSTDEMSGAGGVLAFDPFRTFGEADALPRSGRFAKP